MPIISPDKLIALQRNACDIRNICILAHVDHGKTSLTDALIATNGIISPKMAGKIRYLDSRADEQLRGITMESSAISLCFSMSRRPGPDAALEQKDFLINLIDSPGHVDFSSEVSTASRLCDGALVLVDAVEGVCSQTITVLRQTWDERMKPLLVINKIDRLIWELKMSPSEAYTHLSRLIEEINAVLGSFFQGERMEEDLQWREKMDSRVAATAAKDQNRSTANSVTVSESTVDGDPDLVEGSRARSGDTFEEKDDESIYFAPENNNIIFSSATDGWAFTIRQFASFYEKKLGIKRSALEKVLWGDYYLDPKTKRVLSSKHLKGRALKPMFVQLVLENVWAVYDATTGGSKGKGDAQMLDRITKSLGISIPSHVLRSRDSRALMTTVFSSWLPLSTAVLVSVVEHLPSPPVAQAIRLPALIDASPGADHVSPGIRDCMTNFTASADSPTVAFVSKMVSIPTIELPENKRKPGGPLSPEEARDLARKRRAEISKARADLEIQNESRTNIMNAPDSTYAEDAENDGIAGLPVDQEPESLIGFARLYSGTLSVGDSVYVLSPKFTPAHPHTTPEPNLVTITALYLIMGRSLEALQSVPAGVVFGIGGLEGYVLKSGTICTQLEGSINLAGISMSSQPIVRVALEPTNPGDLGRMIRGMKLLEQSDPCAQYEVLESGEHVISTAGELHLERCLKDLRERFARCEIQAGEPIVPFRESIVNVAEMSALKNKDLPRGTVVSISASQQLSVRLRVLPLPDSITEYLNKHSRIIRQIHSRQKAKNQSFGGHIEQKDASADIGESLPVESNQFSKTYYADFRDGIDAVTKELGDQSEMWSNAADRIIAFGPRRVGPNLLVDSTRESLFARASQSSEQQEDDEPDLESLSIKETLKASEFADRITYAFQLATAQGPLCNEPLHGVGVFLEEVLTDLTDSAEGGTPVRTDLGRLTGEVIRTTREAIHQGFLDWSPRMMLAMYGCEIQASTEVLGRVYAVITRRRGRILSEALNEGTPFFTITSVLPVAESFGFSDEIRKRTSGGASPQLRFLGFERLDQDPFWVPSTEDELEDLGELADRENVAKRYMDMVRRRKGLLIKGARTTEGEKGRTLKK